MEELDHLRTIIARWQALAYGLVALAVMAEMLAAIFEWRRERLPPWAPQLHRVTLVALVLMALTLWRLDRARDAREMGLERIVAAERQRAEQERQRAEQASVQVRHEMESARAELAGLRSATPRVGVVDSLQLRVEISLPAKSRPPRTHNDAGKLRALLRAPGTSLPLVGNMQVSDWQPRTKVSHTIVAYEPEDAHVLAGTPIASLSRISTIELDLSSIHLRADRPADRATLQLQLTVNGVAVKLSSISVKPAVLTRAGFEVGASEVFSGFEERFRRTQDSGDAHVVPHRSKR